MRRFAHVAGALHRFVRLSHLVEPAADVPKWWRRFVLLQLAMTPIDLLLVPLVVCLWMLHWRWHLVDAEWQRLKDRPGDQRLMLAEQWVKLVVDLAFVVVLVLLLAAAAITGIVPILALCESCCRTTPSRENIQNSEPEKVVAPIPEPTSAPIWWRRLRMACSDIRHLWFRDTASVSSGRCAARKTACIQVRGMVCFFFFCWCWFVWP